MFLEELDPKKKFGEYLAYGTIDKPSFGNYGNIFENMNHPNAHDIMFKSRETVKCGVCREEEFSRADNLGRHFKSIICVQTFKIVGNLD